MGTLRHIGFRLVNVIPIVIVVSVLTFLIGHLTPGDPIRNTHGQLATEEQIEGLRAVHGLDLPLWQQYFRWLGKLFTEQGGQSILQNEPVFQILWPSFLNTLVLIVGGTILCVVVGIGIGVIAGTSYRRFLDRFSMFFVQIGSNLSVYWFGLVLIWIFALQLKWLPVSGMQSRNGTGFADLLLHLILPATSAALISMLVLTRFTRINIVHEQRSDYFRTFASQGAGKLSLFGKHVGRNILPPVVNIIGLEIGTLITGAIFVESVFNWPGIGTLLVNAVSGKDYPLIQGGVVLVALCYLVVNLCTDIANVALNPRLKRT